MGTNQGFFRTMSEKCRKVVDTLAPSSPEQDSVALAIGIFTEKKKGVPYQLSSEEDSKMYPCVFISLIL